MQVVQEAHKQVLGLQLPTDPRWVDLAHISLEDILTDHAYCEQKAATSCISLIQAYPEKYELVRELAPIVAEEWAHFRTVLEELDKRNNEKTNTSTNCSNSSKKQATVKPV
jgi:tRNA 2-(methylsulfanyl)-N6-isopentenyladenosine37 hydroxylase